MATEPTKMSDQTLYWKCDGTNPACRDGAKHLSHEVPVERCEHGMIDPHVVEYPHNFPQSKGVCDGSPTLDPFSVEADDE